MPAAVRGRAVTVVRPAVPSSCQTEASGSCGPAATARQPLTPSQAIRRAVGSVAGAEVRDHAGTSSTTASAPEAECRIRLRAGESRSSRSPSTANSRPEWPPSESHRLSRCCWSVSDMTASASSSGAVSAAAALCSCQVPACSSPLAVTSRTLKPRCTRWTATEAATETACSKDEAAPVPRWA